VARELAEWRRAHPKATLAEIEDAVFEAMQKLQARALVSTADRLHSTRGNAMATTGALRFRVIFASQADQSRKT
jgi:hypothetical protein